MSVTMTVTKAPPACTASERLCETVKKALCSCDATSHGLKSLNPTSKTAWRAANLARSSRFSFAKVAVLHKIKDRID